MRPSAKARAANPLPLPQKYGGRSAMPKEAVVLLDTGFQQEVAVCIQVLLVSGNLVGPPTHRRNEKHIFTAKVWMAGVRCSTSPELTVCVSSFQQ